MTLIRGVLLTLFLPPLDLGGAGVLLYELGLDGISTTQKG
jgi:hypothetical protein